MAITVPVRPSLIVHGIVVGVSPRRAYDAANSRRTDEVIGYEVTISQESGAQVKVRYSMDDAQVRAAEFAAIVVDVQESREYGAFLVFQRNVLTDDLDKINSAISQPVKA